VTSPEGGRPPAGPGPSGGPGSGGPGSAGFAGASAAVRAAAADRGLLRRVMVLFRPYREALAGVGALILLTSGLGVVSPL